ncbi:PilW family protein [Pseudoalteromonas sp. H105]|uniref:PilW family protein n=1 Tax=Pseudoalteromonas sp. H105 TaxID=1348393 RepID=UPI0007322062|nr:PilW family protein [Pseudoalteromonas sp. H105]KTF16313.1 pilus assembly protein PilW [Pseudoalteromonas sp. H105]
MKQKGFTLVEMMVALFIGGLVLGGVMFTYVSMKVTTRDTMTIGELQETGRLALSIMQRDIEQIGFWGTFYEDSFSVDNTVVAGSASNPAGDCTEGLNNKSFPDNSVNSNFRLIYAIESSGGAQLNCISNAQDNTDVLQLKFLEGLQIDTADATQNNNGNYYFIAQQEWGEFTRGPANPANPNSTVWRYRHHVYYIDEQTYKVNKQDLTIPVLMRKRLTPKGGMITETIMEGVENMRFLFGLDTNFDSRIDTYRSVENMTDSDWENRRGILTVQVFILVRSLQEDADLNQINQTYTLGEDANQRVLVFNDRFRRALFTTTVRLNNVGASQWRI